jgi:hypothetical protein
MKFGVRNSADGPKQVGQDEQIVIEADNGDIFYVEDVQGNNGSLRIRSALALSVRPVAWNIVDVSRS